MFLTINIERKCQIMSNTKMPNIVFVIKIPNQITLVVWLQLRPEISKWLRT